MINIRTILFITVLFISASAYSDVLYIFDYTKDEFIVGEKKEQLIVGYTKNSRYSDKKSKLSSSFFKRWFGKEKELRYTTVISLAGDFIRQIDYGKNRILEIPFSKLKDPFLHKKILNSRIPEAREMIDERYIVRKPSFTVQEINDTLKIKNFPVRHLKSTIVMETYDKKKNSVSRTEMDLDLYLTKKIKGYSDYSRFNFNLAKRLGINSAKFGNLARILDHWNYPVKKETLKKAEGIAVKTLFKIRGIYITNPGKKSEKRVEKTLQKVVIDLKEAREGKVNENLFSPPEKWKVIKG